VLSIGEGISTAVDKARWDRNGHGAQFLPESITCRNPPTPSPWTVQVLEREALVWRQCELQTERSASFCTEHDNNGLRQVVAWTDRPHR
jgi:hypothetical protein